jgi:hypothetical protein
MDLEKTKEKNQYIDGLKSGIIRAFILALIFAAFLYFYTELLAR